MTITVTDVKILKSERLTDYDDGGGKMTGIEVVDGVMNNLFPDISRLDRTYGRVSLRKAFAAIRSLTTDTYYGAHAIITEPPLDDDVNVTMFSTNSYADERTNARDRIESYLTPSIESRFVLFGNHLTGSSLLSVYCDPSVPSPDIGEVYALRHLDRVVDDETAVELYVQYQRIQRVISRVNGDYIVANSTPPRKINVDVIIMEVSSTFQQDFPGAPPTDVLGSPAKTKINTTNAADAARYYGVTRLSADATLGDFSLTVKDVFQSLVPSAQSETPVIDQPGAAAIIVAAAAATGSITQTSQSWTPGVDNTSYFPRGIVPGTFTLDGTTFDNGFGAYSDGSTTATITYPTGKVVARPSVGGARVMTGVPAAPMSQSGYTSQYGVTPATRAYNYVLSLGPIPAPGSFYVDYKAQGKWYRLRDNGQGQLQGDLTSYGSGTIDYTTGSCVVTVGALPDVNTALLFGWGSRENLEIFTGAGSDVADNKSTVDGSLSNTWNGLVVDGSGNVTFVILGAPISPNSIKLTWQEQTDVYTDQYGQPRFNFVDVTAQDDGSGHLIRPATSLGLTSCGTINYSTGTVVLHVHTDNPQKLYAAGPYVVAMATA